MNLGRGIDIRMKRNVSDLFRALVEVGSVKAVRQEYHVFRTAGGDFVVFSPSSRGSSSFHMTSVPAEKVEAVGKMLTKDGVTTGSLMKDGRLGGNIRVRREGCHQIRPAYDPVRTEGARQGRND